jgi:heme A synthase
LGSELAGVGILVARIAGIALFSLVVACRPRDATRTSVRAMLAYNALVGVYLASLGMSALASGVMLWPAVAIHFVMAIALARRSWK